WVSFGRLALVGNNNHDAPSVLAKERGLRKRTPYDRPAHSTCMASLAAQEHVLQAKKLNPQIRQVNEWWAPWIESQM
ncbi:hypothetical protein, partial [Xanthomonas oryzae]|uniref:hypothetical protein n=1 Tax=Xanthomonas oryzae TaxID=347 RepID=UPI001ED99115